MNTFYNLAPASAVFEESEGTLYGRPEWDDRYGRAEWSDVVKTNRIICPVNPGHQRSAGRVGDLVIHLPSTRVGDFMWTWQSECLVTDRVLTLFREAKLTGFEPRPVIVEKVKRVRKGSEVSIPILWEFAVVGKGGDAHPESGITIIETCEACNLKQYSSYRNGILVNTEQWDGSDFFTVNGYQMLYLVTERVKNLIIANQLTNCALIPAHKMRWPEIVVRPEEVY